MLFYESSWELPHTENWKELKQIKLSFVILLLLFNLLFVLIVINITWFIIVSNMEKTRIQG